MLSDKDIMARAALDSARQISKLQQQLADSQTRAQQAEARAEQYRAAIESAMFYTDTDGNRRCYHCTGQGMHGPNCWVGKALSQPAGQEAQTALDCNGCIYDADTRCAEQCEGCTVWQKMVDAKAAGWGQP